MGKDIHVIQRRDGTVAFSGPAKTKEKLLASQIRKYRGSKQQGTGQASPFNNLLLDDYNFHFLDLNGIDISGSSLQRSTIRAAEVNGCNMSGCDFSDSRIMLFGTNAVLKDAKLKNCDLSGTVLTSPLMSGMMMQDTTARNMELNRPLMDYSIVNNSDLSFSKITDPSLFDAQFTVSNLKGTHFNTTELSEASGIQRSIIPALSSLTKGSSFLACSYSSQTQVDNRFTAIKSDMRSSRMAEASMTVLSAVVAGLSIEKGMEYLKPYLGGMEHSQTIIGGIVLMTGITFLKEAATDKMKENVRTVLSKVWQTGRKMTTRLCNLGVNLLNVTCVIGRKKGLHNLKLAIQSEIHKSGDSAPALIADLFKSSLKGEGIQIIACEDKYIARAMEALTRFYHDKHSHHEDINITLCNPHSQYAANTAIPTSVTLGHDGGMTALWFDTGSGNSVERRAIIRYDKDGQVIEAAGRGNVPLGLDDMKAMNAMDGRNILKQFITAVIQEPYMKRKEVVFDLDTSYVDVADNGDFSIRKTRKNLIDNRYGPALFKGSEDSSRMFFKDGHIMSLNEGWNMMANRQRSPGLIASDDNLLPPLPPGKITPPAAPVTPLPTVSDITPDIDDNLALQPSSSSGARPGFQPRS